jgi:hypothetical protein
MLVQMLPEKVSEYWDQIAPIIEKALPNITASTVAGMANVLRAVMLERAHLWVYEVDGKSKFVMLTTFMQDPITGQTSLFIYSLTSLRQLVPEDWNNAYQTLSKFAKYHGADRVIAFTNNKQIISYINSNGGRATETLIELEV